MIMNTVVREATAADIPAIVAITLEAFTKYSTEQNLPVRIKALDESPETVARDLEHKKIFMFDYRGKPVGSIRVELLPNRMAYISRFGVKVMTQSCGAGSALVRAALKYCQQNDVRAVALHTAAKNFSLIRFYYGKGFYIHSTAADRGYVRACLIKELEPTQGVVDYLSLLPEGY